MRWRVSNHSSYFPLNPRLAALEKRRDALLVVLGHARQRKRVDVHMVWCPDWVRHVPHHSLYVGSIHPPQTQGKVQSAVRLALSGMYLLQASARTGLIDRQMTLKVPEEFILPIMTGLER